MSINNSPVARQRRVAGRRAHRRRVQKDMRRQLKTLEKRMERDNLHNEVRQAEWEHEMRIEQAMGRLETDHWINTKWGHRLFWVGAVLLVLILPLSLYLYATGGVR